MAASFLTDPIFGDADVAYLFADTSVAQKLCEVEAALAEAQGELGIIPAAASEAIAKTARGLSPDFAALAGGTASAGVPVPVLVAALRRAVGEPHGDWVHWGATSQDILDGAIVLCCREAVDLLSARLAGLIDTLRAQSTRYASTVFAGRTRGQVATPITFGLRIAQWAQPLIHLETELPALKRRVLRVQFGGASGAQTAIAPAGPEVAEALARRLGLASGPPWHSDRTPIRHLADWLAKVVSALAKLAGDLVVMSRSEIAEASAGAGGGSSTMPQKSNPVTAEAVLSVSKFAQGPVAALTASAVHAEERDGGNWAVEWLAMPQLFTLAGAALRHGQTLAETLEADADVMAKRLETMPEVMAEAAVFAMAPNLGRQMAQRLVADALAAPEGFAEALNSRGPENLDWEAVLDPRSVVAPSTRVAESIFACRKSPKV
ncbi:MAG: lyase family protein [Pseudomonadota bacterium]